jgi:hypothetical protein
LSVVCGGVGGGGGGGGGGGVVFCQYPKTIQHGRQNRSPSTITQAWFQKHQVPAL